MERILVGMDGPNGAWEALSRAMALARRIEARVYTLLVLPLAPSAPAGPQARDTVAGVRKRLELLLRTARAEGIGMECFVSEGIYEEELVRFIDHNKITLLVAESRDGDSRSPERGLGPVGRILHRVSCRVELVSPRKTDKQTVQEDKRHDHSTPSVPAHRRK